MENTVLSAHMDMLWLAMCSGLVFLMQAGFLCLEAGLTRSKNAINVAIKNLFDALISIMLFWLFAFGLMFGLSKNGILGISYFSPATMDPRLTMFFIFQAVFCATAVTIVSGAVAERMKFSSYLIVVVLISGLIYPVFGHWAWNGLELGELHGFLGRDGFIDFAGSTVVHSIGGWVALACLIIIGPRRGRFAKGLTKEAFSGHNVPLSVLGVIILWFGWFGFNAGSTLEMNDQVPLIFCNTLLAGAAGGLFMSLIGWFRFGQIRVSLPMNGVVAGLVAITANCFAVNAIEAIVIGAIGGAVAYIVEGWLVQKKIDDVIGAVPVHLAAGIWGTLAVGLFGDLQVLDTGLTRWQQVAVQAQGVLVCFAWAFPTSYMILSAINKYNPLRVSALGEERGLNAWEHGATTELSDMYGIMNEQSQSGDLTLRVPENAYTDLGQLGIKYNEVMSSLQRKDQEATEAKDSMNASSKMATLGVMSSGIAHEIRNPLAGIMGFGPMLLSAIEEEAEITPETRSKFKDYLEKIVECGSRITSIIDGLRTFSRDAKNDPFATCSLKKIVDDSIELCQNRIKKYEIQLKVLSGEAPLDCECRSSQICQVLVNLINNAADAIAELPERWIQIAVDDDGASIWITVTDSGTGIPLSIQEKMFGSFYTTKSVGKGTGLGLSISKGLIEDHNGTLVIDNNSSSTCFVVCLPKIHVDAESTPERIAS